MVRAFMSYSHAADGLLAPRVQAALHRLAKPLFSLRAVHVFRDQTTLSATPGLWSAIVEGLDASDFFILLASPTAAASTWVRQEIDHWLTKSPAAERGVARDHFLTVLTEGTIVWDDATRDFDWARTDALPTTLRGVFDEEPLYVDLRFARTDEALSLDHPEFRSRIGDLAATLHGRPKDELIGEDVRIARRTRRLVSTAVLLLALLAGTASIAAWIARVQRNQARSRELAAHAIASLDIDPVRSLASAAEAVDVARTADAVAALREALVRSTVRSELALPARSIVWAALDQRGERVLTEAVDAEDRRSVQLWDATTGEPRCDVAGDGPTFTDDDGAFRTSDGRTYDAASCRQGSNVVVQAPATLDRPAAEEYLGPGSWESATFPDEAGTLEVAYADGSPVVRERGGGRVLRTLAGVVDPIGGARFSRDAGGPSVVVTWPRKDVYTESGGGPTEIGEKVARVWGVRFTDQDRVLAGHRRALNVAELNADATLVGTGSDDRTARIWSTRTGEELTVLRGHAASLERLAFSGDGARVVTVAADGTARVWEPWITPARPIPLGDLFTLRYGVTMPPLPPGDTVFGIPILSADRGTVLVPVAPSRLDVLDRATGARRGSIVDVEFGRLRGALSRDGTRVVVTTGDPAILTGSSIAYVRAVATGDTLAALEGDGGPLYAAAFSPDDRTIAIVGDGGTAFLFDAAGYEEVHRLRAGGARMLDAAFSADGRRLVTASRDALARVWDVRSGALLLELFGHEGGVGYAAFEADDALIVTTGEDGARVWDAQSGKMLGRSITGGDVAFITPDCAHLVAASFLYDRFEAGSQPFGACGPVEEMQALARRRSLAPADLPARPAR